MDFASNGIISMLLIQELDKMMDQKLASRHNGSKTKLLRKSKIPAHLRVTHMNMKIILLVQVVSIL